jgi:hypothetical protein
MFPELHNWKTENGNFGLFATENGNGKHPFVCCKRKWKMEVWANIRSFAANESGKWKFIFPGWQTINGNRLLLFQQHDHLWFLK